MSDTDRIAEILATWRDQRARGEHVEPETIIEDNPEIADELRAQ